MILVSKDRTYAYNMDLVRDAFVDGTKVRVTVDYNERRPLESTAGEYATPSRAEEVFIDLVRAWGESKTKPIGVLYLAED